MTLRERSVDATCLGGALTSAGVFEEELIEDESSRGGDQIGKRCNGGVFATAGLTAPDDHRRETSTEITRGIGGDCIQR